MIDVRPVLDRRSRRQFIDLPDRLYRGNPHWIPPPRITEAPLIDPTRNPFFAVGDMDLFLAWDGDRLVGRIAAIDDHRHNEYFKENVAGFGFFSAGSAEVAAALLDHVDRWAVARGRTAIRGPVNPSLNYTAGLQIDAFDTDPYVMMAWNPPEYVRYVETAGYRPIKDLYCWLIKFDNVQLDRFTGIAKRAARPNLVIRTLNPLRLRAEADRLYEVYCSAWERNWGFVPPTREEFWYLAKELRLIRMRGGLLLAEVDGRPVGCMTGVPDVNQIFKGTNGRLFPFTWLRVLFMNRFVTRTRAVTAGVIPEFRGRGIEWLLMTRFVEVSRQYGFTETEFSWVLDSNPLNRTLARFGTVYKTYRLYQKALGN